MNNTTRSLPAGKAVLITGCSSGIGRQTAITLAQQGFLVFATLRKESDAEKLSGLGLANILPIYPFDLTRQEHILPAARWVADELRQRDLPGLYALVNNAGGGSPAPVELMDLDQFHLELQARVLGSVAMVQAFLPLLRAAGGRIVWIMTPALIPTAYVSGIHACDFAVNCLARTLDIELQPWKIANILVRCGGIKTPAGLRTTGDVEAILQKGPSDRVSLYEGALRKWAAEMAEFDRKRTEPEKVARTVLAALSAKRPKRRYPVGYMAGAASFLEMLPQPLADWVLKRRG